MKLEDKESLIIHIEGLQATLTKRNERIAQLELQVETLKNNPASSANEKKAYKKGWQDCANHMMESTREMARKLSDIRKEAFGLYLDGDRK